MVVDATWLDQILHARMPRDGARGRLALVAWKGSPGFSAGTTGGSPLGLWASCELTRATAKPTSTGICVLVPNAHATAPPSRVEAYLDGWLAAVDRFLAEAAPQVVEHAIPQNLVCADVLALKRAATADDFRAAILAPRRLGRLLGDVESAMRGLDAGRA